VNCESLGPDICDVTQVNLITLFMPLDLRVQALRSPKGHAKRIVA